MKEQNFKSHVRLVPMFHGVLAAMCVACVVLASVNLSAGLSVQSVLLLLLSLSVLISFFFIRQFPLSVQDRAIRAEENLRYYSLAGKLLDKGLSLPQIIALRFADDSEFVALADKALKNKMSNKEIKQDIKVWRADHHRA